jgi:hypothetical protein
MTGRFRPTDAFVDESIRGQRYLMACVLIEARHLTQVRRATAALVADGRRLHFHQELDSVRRSALELFASVSSTCPRTAQNPAPQPKGWQPGPLPTVLAVGNAQYAALRCEPQGQIRSDRSERRTATDRATFRLVRSAAGQ